MKGFVAALRTLLGRGSRYGAARELNGFVDALLQKFEDSRPGLPDATVRSDPGAAERYFLELYEKEVPRLLETIRAQCPHLSSPSTKQFLGEIDEHVRRVVVPAYARLARRFTARERNDFYVSPDSAHIAERIGLGLAGMAIGAFVVWTPFIPLWAKEWVIPFTVAGLLFPEMRRLFAIRRYSGEIEALVERADREIARLDVAYLTSRHARAEVAAVDADVVEAHGAGDAAGGGADQGGDGARPERAREGTRGGS